MPTTSAAKMPAVSARSDDQKTPTVPSLVSAKSSRDPRSVGVSASTLFNPLLPLPAQDASLASVNNISDEFNERLLRLISSAEEEDEEDQESCTDIQQSAVTTSLVDENDILEWENPSYIVKDLDTGESYHVEEIDQQFNLVTLDKVAQQHGSKDLTIEGTAPSAAPASQGDVPTSSYLLSLYTSDETAEIEFEEDHDELTRQRSVNFAVAIDDDVATDPMRCKFTGCTVMHQRASGFCPDHEIIAKEEEDSRAQALYLIPMGARAEFVKISGHSFVYDMSSRLYTVYILEMRCVQSGASWHIYRRYQEFKALNDSLRPMGVRIPLLPPKKLIGSFEPDFILKRQADLSEWLRNLLDYDRVDESAKNPHLLDEVRRFLTAKADQPPLLLDRLPLKRSRFFGASLTDDNNDGLDGASPSGKRTTLQDFQMLQVIGRGSFGKVVLVGHKETKKLYAMKILSKENIVKRKQVEHTRTERRVLGYTTHPFIVGLHFAFQTPQRLYFVLDYCPGGELFYHLSRMKKLPEHMACFYAAEITLALEHLHSLGVVYRDLKPENILLTKDGHIKLADFGLAKEGIRDGVGGTNSLCGTPEYLPPEILDRQGHGTAVDWWNLGMVLYEMLTGLPPWYTNDRKKLFERLRSARLHFPPYVSRRAEALIRQLLNRNPAERLGSKGAHQVKGHLFFEHIDWNRLVKKQITPPFRPCHTAMNDGEAPLNFEAEFTRLPLPSTEAHDGVAGRNRYGRADSDTFQGFTYENPSLLDAMAGKDT